MTHRPIGFMLAAAIGLLAACSAIRSPSWMDPAFADRPIGRTMVMGVSESESLRRQYEALFVQALNAKAVDATTLHATAQSPDRMTEDALARLLEEQKCDSLLITRILSENERSQVVTTGYQPAPYGSYWGYYDYSFTLTYNTAYIQSFLEFELETNLYDVKSRKLVWTGRKTVYDDRSDLSNMKKVIRSVIKDLDRKNLL